MPHVRGFPNGLFDVRELQIVWTITELQIVWTITDRGRNFHDQEGTVPGLNFYLIKPSGSVRRGNKRGILENITIINGIVN
jgi:hypothetical protein